MLWHPTKLEIEDWFDLNLQQFAKIENQNPKLSTTKWLNIYIYDHPYEWFFCEFSVVLYECLAWFTYNKNNHQGGEPKSWTLGMIQEVQKTDNKASQAFEVWPNSILEGYITEFAVDTNKSYSEAERDFFNGP